MIYHVKKDKDETAIDPTRSKRSSWSRWMARVHNTPSDAEKTAGFFHGLCYVEKNRHISMAFIIGKMMKHLEMKLNWPFRSFSWTIFPFNLMIFDSYVEGSEDHISAC